MGRPTTLICKEQGWSRRAQSAAGLRSHSSPHVQENCPSGESAGPAAERGGRRPGRCARPQRGAGAAVRGSRVQGTPKGCRVRSAPPARPLCTHPKELARPVQKFPRPRPSAGHGARASYWGPPGRRGSVARPTQGQGCSLIPGLGSPGHRPIWKAVPLSGGGGCRGLGRLDPISRLAAGAAPRVPGRGAPARGLAEAGSLGRGDGRELRPGPPGVRPAAARARRGL